MTIDERNDEVNKTLESRFSQLNAALEQHETKLKAMMVPLDVVVKYDSCDDEDYQAGVVRGTYNSYIGMIKYRGNWRLCHGSLYESCHCPPEEIEWKPIVEVSIQDRINASGHIDTLRQEIVEAKENLVPDVEKAIEKLAKFLK